MEINNKKNIGGYGGGCPPSNGLGCWLGEINIWLIMKINNNIFRNLVEKFTLGIKDQPLSENALKSLCRPLKKPFWNLHS